MMILAAVILLIGFIALAGMVARVSQLGSQTTIESEQTLLREVGPLGDSMNSAICRLKASTVTKAQVADGETDLNSATVTSDAADFVAANVGMVVSGTGILPGSRILTVTDEHTIVLTEAATVTSTGPNVILRFNSCLPSGTTTTFSRGAATSPTIEQAVAGTMDRLQAFEASRGLFMDWSIGCVGADANKGQVTAHLWDGTIWVEVKSAVMFPRATCTVIEG